MLENNSVLVMGGTCQKTHKHGITKKPTIKNYRISLTFRVLNEILTLSEVINLLIYYFIFTFIST